MMNLKQSARGLARWGAAATIVGLLALNAGCASLDASQVSKSIGDESGAGAGAAEAPGAQASRGKAVSPIFEVAINTNVALERYAYTTSKGAGECFNGKLDRPPFTIDANTTGEFCLHPSDPLDSVDAMVDVTYKIVGDPEGRTVWIKGNGPMIGENTIACEVRRSDMKTKDQNSPYRCTTAWRGDVKTYDPKPKVTLLKLEP